MEDLGRYRDAVYRRICLHCIDLGKGGRCNLNPEQKCAVELYLPEIVKAVQSVKSPRMEDYLAVLRERICSKCKNQAPNGTCGLRNAADCGLDRYFELMVEAVEEVDQAA